MNAPLTLPPNQVKAALRADAARVEAWLSRCLGAPPPPPGLREGMEYSLLAGGKRLRPVLCLVCARLFGGDDEKILPFAAAIECIHTYSLIHDDLPAMDDDDFRRGKPSNHKRFTEATAILAGDALLTDAFLFMASLEGVPAERVLRAVQEAARAAGSAGMVGGQFLDVAYTGKGGVSLKDLAAMHAMKTGALLALPCIAGAVLAGANDAGVERMRAFGKHLGAAFQIADDILDETGDEAALGKPVGSDAARNKNTYPSLLGIEESRKLAHGEAAAAAAALAGLEAPEAGLLRGLAEYTVNRVS